MLLLGTNSVAGITQWAGCNQTCTCAFSDTDQLIIRCDVREFGDLPVPWPQETAELYITINKTREKETPSLAGLNNSVFLTTLDITQQNVATTRAPAMIGPWRHFRLRHLRRLKLSFDCKWIGKAFFMYLDSIEEVDLSNMHELKEFRLEQVIDALAGKPLRRLVLRAVLYIGDDVVKHSLDLKTFLFPLRNCPLEHLDLSDNAITDMSPGVNFYAPKLKKFVARGNFLALNSNPSFLFDLLLHPVLEEVDISRQGQQERRSLRSTLDESRTLHKCLYLLNTNKSSTPSCQVMRCLYPPWFTGIPCKVFPSLLQMLTNESSCWRGIKFSIGKHLRRIDVSHSPNLSRLISFILDKSVCLDEYNSLQQVDLSSTGDGSVYNIEQMRIKGLTSLKYIDVGDNLYEISTLDTVLDDFPSLEVLNFSGGRYKPRRSKAAWSGHTRIRVLDISNNGIVSFPPNYSFTDMPRLERLNLGQNDLTGLKIDFSRRSQHVLTPFNRLE